jgi:hypothetical protein
MCYTDRQKNKYSVFYGHNKLTSGCYVLRRHKLSQSWDTKYQIMELRKHTSHILCILNYVTFLRLKGIHLNIFVTYGHQESTKILIKYNIKVLLSKQIKLINLEF